jgi:hypothetical protein
MPKITITFLEEGGEPIEVELSEKTSTVLELFVADQNAGKDTPEYYGKADLFMKHTVKSLINPLVEAYKSRLDVEETLTEIESLNEQKKVLEQTILAEFMPKLKEAKQ